MNYLDAFDRSVRCHPERDAVRTDDGRSLTYADLDDRTDRLATALETLAPGERVATLAYNGSEVVEVLLASHKRGLGNVQLPFRESAGALAEMLEPTDPAVLVFDGRTAERALDVLDRTAIETGVSIDGDGTDREDVREYESIVADVDPDAGRPQSHGNEHGMLFTSGTTGVAKAVPFDQEQLWYGSTQDVMEMQLDHRDVGVIATPWYHMVTTNAWIMPHLQAGGTLVIQTAFDPSETLSLIESNEATGLIAVPTQLHTLVDEQREGGYNLASLSYIRTGGSVVTEELSEAVAEHLCEGLYNTYGLTEGGPNLAFADPETQRANPGTIGTESFTWEVRVVESTGPEVEPDPTATVDPGETGEVIGNSPGMATEYVGRPHESERLTVDGWLRTGDVARIDEDGLLYIVDRVDNMIVSGGENVYPQEVENALTAHENVDAAAVVGREDDRWGQRIAAVVAVTGDVSEADLDEHCRVHDGLADFKRPREYVITRESFPRTETGKLRRGDVRTRFFEE
ncbi:AMP-binding protein [Halopenitus sp. POP-27]|uniref:class I adenylate-forming enzyme family protein n=1 Tax=Halopenitus sp. POP-27 TaxID=2994425 RepID=UPI0024688351|nr:AMP-binding protein [Halopenitus sp. POP-27]